MGWYVENAPAVGVISSRLRPIATCKGAGLIVVKNEVVRALSRWGMLNTPILYRGRSIYTDTR